MGGLQLDLNVSHCADCFNKTMITFEIMLASDSDRKADKRILAVALDGVTRHSNIGEKPSSISYSGGRRC